MMGRFGLLSSDDADDADTDATDADDADADADTDDADADDADADDADADADADDADADDADADDADADADADDADADALADIAGDAAGTAVGDGRATGEATERPGDAGRGVGDAGRVVGDAGRGVGDAGRGVGDAGRGVGDAGRGVGDAGERSGEGGARAERSAREGSPAELVGEDLALGYPTTDMPVVECEHVLLPAGEVTALVGPNGSGKSTLLKAMAHQLEPWAGGIVLDGAAVQSFETKALARKLGLLSQQNTTPESITVEDLAYHGRYPHRGFFEAATDADHAAVDRAIDLAGVEHLREQEMSTLSGGQKQLAWIAMVLAQQTDVLLLDEPTNHLDLHHQLRVMEVLRSLNEDVGVTIGIVLHDVGQAARFADNLVAMSDGGLYDWGPPRDVVTEELLADVFAVDATVDAESPTGPHISPHAALEGESE